MTAVETLNRNRLLSFPLIEIPLWGRSAPVDLAKADLRIGVADARGGR
jgi:hypothetical protein